MKKGEVSQQVLKAVQEVAGDAIEIKKDTEFKSIGLDSLSFVKVVVSLEDELDFEFDDEYLDYKEFDTVEDLCECVWKMVEQNN